MSAEPARLRLALCGDVMLGRGVDQILPHPGNPAIYVSQSGITDANVYVRAAEQRHGAIPAAAASTTCGAMRSPFSHASRPTSG